METLLKVEQDTFEVPQQKPAKEVGKRMADAGDAPEAHSPAVSGDTGSQQPADRSAATAAVKNPDKVVILAKNVANAPILKTTQFSASASHPFSKVIQHIQVFAFFAPQFLNIRFVTSCDMCCVSM